MGRLKDTLLEAEGWERSPGKFVSADCFDDRALQEVVQDNLVSRTCSYTRRRGETAIAAPLDAVVERIFDCLEQHYDDAANGVGWEGGWVGADTWDTYDLIQETVEFSGKAPDRLFDDIVNALPARDWSRTNPYGPRKGDVMNWSWESFTNTVKHVRRYFFQQRLEPADPHGETVSPADLLASVAANCRRYGLVRNLTAGQRFYRCRPREGAAPLTQPLDMGPPPPKRASQSRMSPAGIPMFYGALNRPTAIAETISEPTRYAVAEFRTTRSIQVLDLTRRPWVSIFDDERGNMSEWCRFMRAFITDFERPVLHNGEQHYEYVPTQIVTEFLRSAPDFDPRLDGILYNSVQNPGEVCVVLFVDRNEVGETPDASKTPVGPRLLKMRRIWNKRNRPGE